MRIRLPPRPVALMLASVGMAGAAGYGASVALGLVTAGSPPTVTTTVNVGQGATGPAGPPGPSGATGPAGPAGEGGANQCPTGSTFTAVVLNAPGGHVELWACVKD